MQHVILAPWMIHHIYLYVVKGEKENSGYFIFPILLFRVLHNQLWISLSRYRTAKGNNRIIDKGIEFDQVDRERNWSATLPAPAVASTTVSVHHTYMCIYILLNLLMDDDTGMIRYCSMECCFTWVRWQFRTRIKCQCGERINHFP